MGRILVVDQQGTRWVAVAPQGIAPGDWVIDGTRQPPTVVRGDMESVLSRADFLALARCVIARRVWLAKDLYPDSSSSGGARKRFEQARARVEGKKKRGAYSFAAERGAVQPSFRFVASGVQFCLVLLEDDAKEAGAIDTDPASPEVVEPEAAFATSAVPSVRPAPLDVTLKLYDGYAVCWRDTPVVTVRIAVRSNPPADIVRFELQIAGRSYFAIPEPDFRLRREMPLRGWMLHVGPAGVQGLIAFPVRLWGDPAVQGFRASLVAELQDGARLVQQVVVRW